MPSKKQTQETNEPPVLMRKLLKQIKKDLWPDLSMQSVEKAARDGVFKTARSGTGTKARYLVKRSVLCEYIKSLGVNITF